MSTHTRGVFITAAVGWLTIHWVGSVVSCTPCGVRSGCGLTLTTSVSSNPAKGHFLVQTLTAWYCY